MVESVYIKNKQCPGDICMLTSAVRDLKKSHPELRINVGTSASYLWDNNPYLDRSVTATNADKVIKAEYPLIHKSNKYPYHFIHGFRMFLAKEIGAPVGQGEFCADIHLSDKEKAGEENAVEVDLPERYWILNAGYKTDYTCKGWAPSYFRKVVEMLKDKVTFVQIGEVCPAHKHPDIPGVIDLRGKTKGRKIVTLMHKAAGVVTGVSFAMHLSTMPTVDGKLRPCVCIAGGREPITWYQQRNMQALHTIGALECCSKGGCWKSRVEPLHDGNDKADRLCTHITMTSAGEKIPTCMAMISPEDVARKVLMYEKN